MILGKPPKMLRDVKRIAPARSPLSLKDITIAAAVSRVLAHPAVANKTFLVSIGDRTVGGLCARDPFVGPWQVPVADCAVTLLDYEGYAGEAFAVGERTPLALIDAPASGRMAVGEALTNISRRASRFALQGEALRQLDGSRGLPGRGRGALRHGKSGRARAVPGARHLDPGGQGFALDAHGVGRQGSGGAAVAHRVGLRAGGGRARRAHAAAAHRRRRDRARARRPRPRPEPPRRLDPRAGVLAARRRLPGSRRSCAVEGILLLHREKPRSAARLPRPLRRRLVRHGVRDGVRRALRRYPQPRPDRLRSRGGRRRRVQARRRGAARRPRPGPRAARALRRRARRGAADPRRGPRARHGRAARRRPRRARAPRRQPQRARRAAHHAQQPRGVPREARPPAAHLERDHLAHAGAARQPGVRARGVRPHHRAERSRVVRGA